MPAAHSVDPQPRRAIEGSVAALQRLAESDLPASLESRLRDLGQRKDSLREAELEEYSSLVDFWKSRTLEKAEAAVALQRLRAAIPDLAALS